MEGLDSGQQCRRKKFLCKQSILSLFAGNKIARKWAKFGFEGRTRLLYGKACCVVAIEAGLYAYTTAAAFRHALDHHHCLTNERPSLVRGQNALYTPSRPYPKLLPRRIDASLNMMESTADRWGLWA